MAQRRMFSMRIVDSDAFLEMPQTAQLLYFHLAMRADDDGFIGNPKRIMRTVGSGDDDMKLLLAKRFLLAFEAGIVVVKHWRIHNYIQSDRYTPTQYLDEKKQLKVKENGAYTECIQNGSKADTQDRLGKDRSGEVRSEVEEAPALEAPALEEPAKPTPKAEAVQFFADMQALMNGEQNNLGTWLAEKAETTGIGKQRMWQEAQKFTAYWSEPTPSGKKQLWETKKTWEWRRRFATWIGRSVENTNTRASGKQLFV